MWCVGEGATATGLSMATSADYSREVTSAEYSREVTASSFRGFTSADFSGLAPGARPPHPALLPSRPPLALPRPSASHSFSVVFDASGGEAEASRDGDGDSDGEGDVGMAIIMMVKGYGYDDYGDDDYADG